MSLVEQFVQFILEVSVVSLSLGSSFSLGLWSLLFTGELFRVELSSLETSGLSAVLAGVLS